MCLSTHGPIENLLHVRIEVDVWHFTMIRSIVVGGRVFYIAGGSSNMYIVVYIPRVYTGYTRYVYSMYSRPPARTKSQKWRPPTTMIHSLCVDGMKVSRCKYIIGNHGCDNSFAFCAPGLSHLARVVRCVSFVCWWSFVFTWISPRYSRHRKFG